jgi:predicted dehydrogenase
MPEKIRFAQLSFWFSHGHGLASAAKSNPNAELACVWDEDADRGAAAAERHGVPFVADLDELLGRDDVDAVGICGPTQLHGEHIVRAAEAGKHCLVEKPFTRTVAQADAAIRAAEAAGVQVMPAYNLRFSQANEKMKQIVDSGVLGRLYHVRRRHGQFKYGPFGYDAEAIVNDPDSPWGDDPVAEGRRCLIHAGSHAVYWMLWMFGMPESVVSLSVAAVPGLPQEDNNVSVFRYAGGGPLVTLQSSQTETAAPLATEIYGFEGAAVQTRGDGPSTRTEFADLGAVMLYRNETKAWETIPDIDRRFNQPGTNSPDQFFNALAAGKSMPVTMDDGRNCVIVLEAAERAENEKRQVEIAEWEVAS